MEPRVWDEREQISHGFFLPTSHSCVQRLARCLLKHRDAQVWALTTVIPGAGGEGGGQQVRGGRCAAGARVGPEGRGQRRG